MEYIYRYNSPLGDITLAACEDALCGLWFDGQQNYGFGLSHDAAVRKLPVFEQTIEWLDTYFSGTNPSFTPALDMRTGNFRREIWKILLGIPYGQTMTYGEVADAYADINGKRTSPRAVGTAVAHNAISLIIPCHRVVGANGSLTGYAGGIDRKRELLKIEGVQRCVK